MIFIAVLTALLLLFIPETPAHLLHSGKESKALSSLQRLRGKGADVRAEFKAVKEQVAAESAVKTISWKSLFTERIYSRPLLAALVLMFLQQFSGLNAVMFNVQVIFRSTESSLDPSNFIII